jgi:hypothetical protein
MTLQVTRSPVTRSTPVINKTLLWEGADIELYQSSLETLLEQNFQFWNAPECISTLALLVPLQTTSQKWEKMEDDLKKMKDDHKYN